MAQRELPQTEQVECPVNCTPSELSTFLQALAEGYLATCSLDTDQSAPSRLNHIASKSYQRGRKTVSFHGFQYTMTFKPLTESHGADLLTWYREVSLAKTYPQPEKERVSTANAAECGRKWHGSLAKYDPATCSWRTAQCSLLGGLTEYSATFPRWGMVRPMASLEHITREHRINATEYGYSDQDCEAGQLPHQDNSAEIVCDMRMRDDQTAVCVWSLGGRATLYEAEILFTEMQGCRRGEGRGIKESISPPGEAYAKAAMRAMRIGEQVAGASYRQGCIEQHADELANALRELSQYVALERQEGQWKLNIGWDLIQMEGPVLRREQGNLMEAVVKRIANTPSGNWPTPTCADAFTDKLKSSQQQEGSMHSVNLSQAVKMWPTPCASDDRDRGNMANPAIKRRVEMGKQVMLSMAVKEDVGGGQLNPDWVEWLMNWPVSWSSLTPLSHEHFNEWLARTKAGATRIQADILPRMRNQGQPAQTPQGPGQAEQHAGEYCDTVPSMPREGTREEGRLGEGKCSASPLSDMRSSVQIEQDAKRQGVQRFLQGGNGQAVGSEAMGWTEQGEAMHELRKDIHIHTTASKDMQPVVREHSGPPEPWWSAEPVGVPRVATGIAKRADRLKCIGNGQVPQVAALAWNTLHERIQSRLNP